VFPQICHFNSADCCSYGDFVLKHVLCVHLSLKIKWDTCIVKVPMYPSLHLGDLTKYCLNLLPLLSDKVILECINSTCKFIFYIMNST